MKKTIKILPLIILGILSILLMGERVHFGLGLGDIIYHGMVYIGFIIYSIHLLVNKESPERTNLIFPIFSLLFCAYLILSMTIWRGAEYSWNGDILAPINQTKH